jgi:hypothetical protein
LLAGLLAFALPALISFTNVICPLAMTKKKKEKKVKYFFILKKLKYLYSIKVYNISPVGNTLCEAFIKQKASKLRQYFIHK